MGNVAMTPEQMEAMWREHGEPAAKVAFTAGYAQGYGDGESSGYLKGLAIGNVIGYSNGHRDGVASCKPAISDGLKNGSSACGDMMQSFRSDRAGADDFVTDAEYELELLASFDQ